MEAFSALELVMGDQTFSQRQKGFKKLSDAFANLVNEAARDRVESIVILVGNSVNEDLGLSQVHKSPAMDNVSIIAHTSMIRPSNIQ